MKHMNLTTLKKTAHHTLIYLLIMLLISPSYVLAAPIGANVVAGQVNISQQATTTQIQQLSNKAIINWQGFNISAKELVQFLQPGADSIALNRVVGGNPTEILGQLSANGRVFILNPNGIVFGSTARIDVSGLLASTLNINDQDFLNNRFNFTEDPANANANVINQGKINISDGGFAFLVAPGVKNEGLIVARLGQVALASGNKMTIDFQGNGLISFAVTGEVANKVNVTNGQSLAAQVSNSGLIQATGGQVIMQGSTIGDAFTSVVNNTGTIQAHSLQNNNGRIILSGGKNAGIVSNTGILDTSAIETNASGGNVIISGHFAGNDGTILAQGLGTANGGLVQLNSAKHTITTSNSLIDVSGGEQGNGGNVIVRSDNHLTFDGQVNTKGGSITGDGGFVDLSSPGQVEILGQVDASAPNGKTGTLLIDPQFLEINNVGGVAFATTLNQFALNQGLTTVISATSINALVANVILQANTDITVNSAINIVNAGTTLTLQAGRSILVNQNITTNNGAIVMTANDPLSIVADRLAGAANITMAAGTSLNAGNANVNLTVSAVGNGAAGSITTQDVITTGAVVVDSAVDAIVNGANFGTGSTSVSITADNDVTLGSVINTGIVSLAAGRSVNLNSNITATGAVNIIANDVAATAANRVAGNADIIQSAGTVLGAGAGNINLTVNAAGNGVAGATQIDNITTTGNLTINSVGAITETVADATVDLTANNMTLNTTGVGATIGSPGAAATDPLEIAVIGLFNLSTSNEAVAIDNIRTFITNTFPPIFGITPPPTYTTTDLNLGTIDVGTSTFIATVTNGGFVDGRVGAGAAPNITAGIINLVTQGGNDVLVGATVIGNNGILGGSIGTLANPIRTEVGILSATASNQSIYINEASGLLLSGVTAQQQGAVAQITPTAVIVKTIDNQTTLVGINDVMISAVGDIIVHELSATRNIQLSSSTGSILDNNQAAGNFTAKQVTLSAATGIGNTTDPLEFSVENLSATTSNGSVFLAMGLPSVVDMVTAGGVGNEIQIETTQSSLGLGSLTTNAGIITLNALAGSIFDSNGATSNLVADSAVINAQNGVGVTDIPVLGFVPDALETTLNSLTVDVTTVAGAIHIDNSTALTNLGLKVNQGNINLGLGGGLFSFDTATNTLASAGINSINFENTGGNIAIGTIDATNLGTVNLTASGAITSSASSIVADVLNLTAGSNIGATGNVINTTVNTATLNADVGGVFIQESNGLSANVTAVGGDVFVGSTTGDISIDQISSTNGAVTVIATAGALVSGAAPAKITGTSAILSAGTSIGSAASVLSTQVSTLDATASAGGLFINNSGDLILTNATATGAALSFNNTGTLALGTVSAAANTATITNTGAITDNNAATINITANALTINGTSIGVAGSSLDINVSSLNAAATAGGIYINSMAVTPLALLDATAVGANADVDIQAAGTIDLGLVKAQGDLVALNAAGAINDANAGAINIIADKMTIAATGGVGVGDTLEVQVTQLTAGPNSNIANAGPLAITQAGLQAGGSSFTADSITILDMGGTVVALPVNASLNLTSTIGNIVFLNPNDTLATSGTGSITIIAGTVLGSGAVAALGNLTTVNQNITILADSHISIGLLSAGVGNVSLTSISGAILDNNGALNNIIANNVTISGVAASARTSQLYTINAIASANAKTSEVAATLTLLEANKAASFILDTANTTQLSTLNQNSVNFVAAAAAVTPVETAFWIATTVKNTASVAATVLSGIQLIAETAAAVAEGVPMTGDGGALTVVKLLGIAAVIASGVADAGSIAADALAFALSKLAGAATTAEINYHAAKGDYVLTQANLSAAKESQSISQAAYDKAIIARDAAWQVSNLAILAENTASTAGTLANPFGIQATGNIDVAAQNSDVALSLLGTATLGNISANKADGTAFVSLVSVINLNAIGAISANDYIHLETTNGTVNAAAPASLTAKSLVTIATAGVGNTGALNSNVDVFAANAGTGGVALLNQKALTIGVVDGVTGVTATQAVNIAAIGGMTVANNVTSSAANVVLDAGTGIAIVDNLLVNATTTVNGATGVTLNAGDNITLTAGSQLTGTNIVVAANRAGDGVADGVTGSVVLAGNINGSAVTVSGGGVNQTGAIVSTGTVNISAASTPTSAIQGISLGSVQAAGQVDVVSSNALTLNQNVTSTGGAINLTASNNVASIDNLTVNAVTVSSNVGVNMTSGDNVTLVAGSQINGTDIIIKADNVADGFADTLTGGVTLAGNINSSTVTVTGGGLNHTGTITTTGLVNLAATSTASSAIQGMSLATILAGGVVNAVSSNALTLTQNVTSTTGPMTLTAGNSAAIGDDLTINANVLVNSGAALNINAGDNITVAAGSVLTGTGFVMNADNDGIADGVTGSIDLAGNVNATTVNITGGGLNHAGTITSAGLVNIAATSTPSSATQGIALATILAGGVVDVVSSNALTLNQNVSSTGGAINLTASNNVASIDNLTVNAVTVSSNVSVNMTSGDNVTLVAGSQINGTDIIIKADNVADGFADTLTGGVTLAGNINSSTLTVTGGGLNHTGTITTTGLVNLAATSTASSAIQGMSLATILAGGVVDAVSSNALTLTQNVTSTTGPMTLTAGNSAAIGDDLTINANVLVNSGAALNINAGDNITVATGSVLTGTTFVMNANTDGIADGVTGSINLAGNVNATTVNITGGGLNHTGTITSAGLVNIAATSTPSSATQGIALATILAGGVVDVVSSNALTLNQNVTSTAGAINLTASNNTASIDNLTVNAVTVSSNVGVNMVSGDNVTLVAGSQINGTDIVITADNAGDGLVDTLTGGVTLAGNINSSTLTVTGGGLNHTGIITTTGLVNLAATSTASSAIQGMSLATILAGGVVNAVSSNALTLTQNVTSTAGPMNLTAGNSAAVGDDLTINANVLVNSGAVLNINAGDNINTALGSSLVGTAVTMNANVDGSADTVTGNINLLGTTNGTNISMTAGGLNQVGTITSTGPVNITTVSTATSVTNGISLGLIQAAGQTVNLSATGTPTAAILDNNDAIGLANMNIQAANLSMLATGGVGTALNPIETTVSRLAAQGNAGGVAVANTGNLTLGAVGAVNNVSATAGAINLSTLGNLAIENAAVQAAGLNVSLLATGGSITEALPGIAADIVAATLNLNVTGLGSSIGTVAQRLEINAATLNASTQGGSIYLGDTAGGLSLGLVNTTQAAGSVIDLLVTGGSLTQLPNAIANTPSLIGNSMNLAVTGVASSIGTANQYLTLDAVTLNNVQTQGGDIFIVDTNGGVAINSVSTLGKVGSQIALTSLNGSILEALPADPGLEFNAGTVTLQVNAPNTNIGTPAQPLEILASNIILNNLTGLRSFINVPAAGTVALPVGQLNTPAFLPVIQTPTVPSNVMIVGGNVVGGVDVALFTQAQSALSSTTLPGTSILSVPNMNLGSGNQAAFNLANLIGGGSGYWGIGL